MVVINGGLIFKLNTMANHNEWMELTILEKIDMVGKVTHLLQNDIKSFEAFKKWIDLSEVLGLFNDVKINDYELHDNSGSEENEIGL